MQKLYTNGTILTMKENELYSEALLIRERKYSGSRHKEGSGASMRGRL
ncbi:MAG: hypothetical protein ACLTW1_16500 [[Clostridium] innocuum]